MDTGLGMEYFVKWENYPESDNSWITSGDFGTNPQMVKDYHAAVDAKKKAKKRTRRPRDFEETEFEEACDVMRRILKVIPGSRLPALMLVSYYVNDCLKVELTTENLRSYQVKVGKAVEREFP